MSRISCYLLTLTSVAMVTSTIITTIITITPSTSPTITITAIHITIFFTLPSRRLNRGYSRVFLCIVPPSQTFSQHLVPVTLGREAEECYHLPKVNSQTSGGKEASYFSILDLLQAKSNRFPIDQNLPLLLIHIIS